MIGKTVSHYKIIEKLGQGGMGVVYKAEDTTLKRTVALKFLGESSFAEEGEKLRFIQEAQAAASLDHPNICTVFEVDKTDDGQIFIAMAYYDGEPLKDKMSRGPLPVDEAIDIAIQVAQGLRKAHEHGIIHRDIKPANIMLTRDGTVKIVDFGLAKLAGRPGLTMTGSTLGTAAYMSPEQSFGETVDHRADIWSLGIVVYEMLAGHLPFRGEYEHAILYAIVNDEPEPITSTQPAVPVEVEEIIGRALQKKVDGRYASVDELLHDLLSVREPTGVDTRTLAGKPPLRRTVRKHLLGGLAVLVVLTALIGLYLWRSVDVEARATSIAVMPFSLMSEAEGWSWLRVGLADLLSTDMAEVPALRVLDAQQQIRAMRRLGIKGTDLTEEQALAIGRRTRVRTVLMGTLSIAGSDVEVHARLLDTDAGAARVKLNPVSGRIDQLYDLVDELASQIQTALHLGSKRSQTPLKASSLVSSSLEAQRYYIEGLDAAYDLRHQESIEKLGRAISLDSSFIKPYYHLAWQYRMVGDYASAKAVLVKGRPYIAHLSEEARLEYLANEASIDHRWQELATYSKRLLAINPLDSEEHFRYGWVLYRKFRELDDGIAAMEKSLGLDSTYAIAYNTLAFAYLARGETRRALQVIDKGIALDRTDVNTRDSKAEIQVLVGQTAEAIQTGERILELKPDFLYTPLQMIRAYLAQGRYARAFDLAQQYVARTSNSVFRSRGLLLQSYSRWYPRRLGQALDLVDQALAVDPDNLEAHWARGQIHLEMGNRETAAAVLDTLRQMLSKVEGLEERWFLHHLMGKIALFGDEVGKAIESFHRALRLYPPDRPLYLTALGNAHSKAGQHAQAVEIYRAALEFNPRHARAAFGLAQAYEALGDESGARKAYDRVVEIWSEADPGLKELEIARRRTASL